MKRVFPAKVRDAGATFRSAKAVPVSSSRTKARGRPVAAQKKRMIQRSAEQTLSRASAGSPKGPIPKETSVTAVAAKKKIDAIAMRRRSSCAASLAQMAHARAREFTRGLSQSRSPSLPVT